VVSESRGEKGYTQTKLQSLVLENRGGERGRRSHRVEMVRMGTGEEKKVKRTPVDIKKKKKETSIEKRHASNETQRVILREGGEVSARTHPMFEVAR